MPPQPGWHPARRTFEGQNHAREHMRQRVEEGSGSGLHNMQSSARMHHPHKHFLKATSARDKGKKKQFGGISRGQPRASRALLRASRGRSITRFYPLRRPQSTSGRTSHLIFFVVEENEAPRFLFLGQQE